MLVYGAQEVLLYYTSQNSRVINYNNNKIHKVNFNKNISAKIELENNSRKYCDKLHLTTKSKVVGKNMYETF